MAVACVAPFVYLLVLSFAERWAFPEVMPASWSGRFWVRALTGGALTGSFGISLVVSLLVAVVSTAAGFVTAKYVAYHRHRQRLLLLAYVPFAMSPVILGTCLMYLYLRAGLVGTVAGVVIAQTTFAYGYAIVLFTAFWSPRTKDLEALVYTLGGSPAQAYRRVLLPVAKGALLLCFFQTFLLSWFQYGLTLLIGAGKIQTLPLKVYDYVNEANPYNAAVASCLLVLPPVLMLWANKRALSSGGLQVSSSP
ncbi:MAG: ABC transporter permease subunit [Bacteroidota bacterium]